MRAHQLQAKFFHLWCRKLALRKLERLADEYRAQKAKSMASRAWATWKTQHQAAVTADLQFVGKAFTKWRNASRLLATERTLQEKAGRKCATAALVTWENAFTLRAKEKLADEYRRKVRPSALVDIHPQTWSVWVR